MSLPALISAPRPALCDLHATNAVNDAFALVAEGHLAEGMTLNAGLLSAAAVMLRDSVASALETDDLTFDDLVDGPATLETAGAFVDDLNITLLPFGEQFWTSLVYGGFGEVEPPADSEDVTRLDVGVTMVALHNLHRDGFFSPAGSADAGSAEEA